MAVDLGPRLGLLINADIGEAYYDQFRPFLRAIDSLLQGSVINASTTAPPSSPSNGDAYLILGTPSGAWTGHINAIAVWSTEITQSGNNTKVPGWQFFTPNNGWMVWNNATNLLMVYESAVWRNFLQDVPLLDVNNNWVGFQGFVGGFVVVGGQMQLEGSGAATSGANVNSSLFVTIGSYWNGSSAQPDIWAWQSQLGTGTNPTSTLNLTHSGTPGFHSAAIDGLIVSGNNIISALTNPIVATDLNMSDTFNHSPGSPANILFWALPPSGADVVAFGRPFQSGGAPPISTGLFHNSGGLFLVEDTAAETIVTSTGITSAGHDVLIAQAAPTSSATASNLSIPVVIGGTTYYVRLSSTP